MPQRRRLSLRGAIKRQMRERTCNETTVFKTWCCLTLRSAAHDDSLSLVDGPFYVVSAKLGGDMAEFFGWDENVHGFFVVVEKEPLTSNCLSPHEIDFNVARLKEDLDRVGVEMKAQLPLRAKRSMFDAEKP